MASFAKNDENLNEYEAEDCLALKLLSSPSFLVNLNENFIIKIPKRFEHLYFIFLNCEGSFWPKAKYSHGPSLNIVYSSWRTTQLIEKLFLFVSKRNWRRSSRLNPRLMSHIIKWEKTMNNNILNSRADISLFD